MRHIIAIFLALCLTACGAPAASAPGDASQGGGLAPESVVKGFFEDLEAALKDPALVRSEPRQAWVERLAGYFAPNERADQRLFLSDALASFAGDRAQLAADETLTIEINFDEPRSISHEGDRALVKLPNASIFMQIARVTENGPVTIYEQPIGLERVIGRADGAVPTVRVGNRWYLTEG